MREEPHEDASLWLERARAHPAARRDARLASLLAHARIEREPTVVRAWESSGGTVRAYRVLLWVTAGAMADAAKFPSVMDELTEALSSAVATDRGCSLESVSLRWGRVAHAQHGYRAAPASDLATDDPAMLRSELATVLLGLGEHALARAIERATTVSLHGDSLRVEGVSSELRRACEQHLRALATTVTVR
jgi:hypothetical protein